MESRQNLTQFTGQLCYGLSIRASAMSLCCMGKGVMDCMIEIIYKEEKQEARGNQSLFHLPKNIRQIGECKGSRRIYVEDYVYTFLRRMEERKRDQGTAGILLGKYNWKDGISYLFIRSALEIENMEVSPEHIRFTDAVWTEIHSTVQQYFKGQEILGWFLNLPEHPLEINEVILRAHLNHFGGNDKVLFLTEPTEKEEAFFSYDSSRLKKENGYYIYYEKNEAMQNYMVQKNQSVSTEAQGASADQAVRDFRKLVEKKKEEKEKKSGHSLLYGLTACVAAASLVIAFTYTGGADAIRGIFSRFSVSSDREDPDTISVNGNPAEEVTKPEELTKTPEVTELPTLSETPTPSEMPEPSDIPESSGIAEPSETSDSAASVSSAAEVSPPEETEVQQQNTVSEDAETKETTARVQEYIVQQGDTLFGICRNYYGNLQKVSEICAVNGIMMEDVIYPGQKIILPQ